VINRCEMNGALTVALATFFSGNMSALLEAQEQPAQNGQGHMQNMSSVAVEDIDAGTPGGNAQSGSDRDHAHGCPRRYFSSS
jgi:hypothetical protein